MRDDAEVTSEEDSELTDDEQTQEIKSPIESDAQRERRVAQALPYPPQLFAFLRDYDYSQQQQQQQQQLSTTSSTTTT
jgi:hypothetical protein